MLSLVLRKVDEAYQKCMASSTTVFVPTETALRMNNTQIVSHIDVYLLMD